MSGGVVLLAAALVALGGRERLGNDLRTREHADHAAENIESADASDVTGTPSLFVNGRRNDGAYDLEWVSRLVAETLAPRAASGGRPPSGCHPKAPW